MMIGKDDLIIDIGDVLLSLGRARPAEIATALADLAGTIVFVIEANGHDAAECDARVLRRLAQLRAAYPAAPDPNAPPLPLEPDPAPYSADWLRRAVTAKQFETRSGCVTLDHHACSGCGHVVFYSFDLGDNVWFNPACHCGSILSAPELRSYDEVAKWLAMQPNDEARAEIWGRLT